MNIYVASSWRNERQHRVVSYLRSEGHDVYDFKNPSVYEHGFSWEEVDGTWQLWLEDGYIAALQGDAAARGFERDLSNLNASDVCVIVLPCGRSAHLDAGWAKGQGKVLAVLLEADELSDPTGVPFDLRSEPELMYRWADWIGSSTPKLCEFLHNVERRSRVQE